MNLKTLIVVVLRLLAIEMVIQTSVVFVPLFFRPFSGGSDNLAFVVASVCLFTCAAIMWHFAPAIANFVSSGLPQEISFGALSLTDCYTVAFVGVGLLQIASRLGAVIYLAFAWFKSAASPTGNLGPYQISGASAWQAFIPLVIGAVLFINGRRWAVALARHQTGSPPPTEPVSPTAVENK